jgi:serine phosphatase RsbU (regulator of sigma subunit)
VTSSRLARLIDRATLDPLLAAACEVAPGAAVRVRDDAGTELTRQGGDGATPDAGTAIRAIRIGDDTIGEVLVDGPIEPRTAGAMATLLAASMSVLASEAEARRAIASEAMDRELAIGRRIQRSLMPRRFPELPGWEIAAAYEAAREVGGDLYDAFPIQERPGVLAFTIADVTGKGIPAALLMADTRALIHAAADHAPDPAESLARVNKILREERATTLFVTVAHGTIEAATGDAVVAGGGHEPLHVIHPDGSLTTLEVGGHVIGMVADVDARLTRLTVQPGDTLVAHTDGVTEARSPDGRFYGDDRFEALLATLGSRSASEVVDAVVDDVAAFRAGAEASDDLTLLVIRRLPEGMTAGG